MHGGGLFVLVYIVAVGQHDAVVFIVATPVKFVLLVEIFRDIEAVLFVQIYEKYSALAPPEVAERYCSILQGAGWMRAIYQCRTDEPGDARFRVSPKTS